MPFLYLKKVKSPKPLLFRTFLIWKGAQNRTPCRIRLNPRTYSVFYGFNFSFPPDSWNVHACRVFDKKNLKFVLFFPEASSCKIPSANRK